MSGFLAGKRILVVGRDYFFYTREIVGELRSSFGAHVTHVPIEPPSPGYNVMKRFPRAAAGWLRRHHERALAGLRIEAFDVVLFIQVHQMGDLARRYREAFPAARFILYYWDSLKTHDYLPYLRYFDEALSFDREDTLRHSNLRYLPLFYCERFRGLREQTAPCYDLSFVGTAVNLVRYDQVERFREWAVANRISFYDYVLVSPFNYVKYLLRGRRLRKVHFTSLSESGLLRIYAGSRAVLDLPNNIQSGFTMRTFESLGAHRKLITTNRNAASQDFFTPESVFILGAQGAYPTADFMTAPLRMSPHLERYSLRSWIEQLMRHAVSGGSGERAQTTSIEAKELS